MIASPTLPNAARAAASVASRFEVPSRRLHWRATGAQLCRLGGDRARVGRHAFQAVDVQAALNSQVGSSIGVKFTAAAGAAPGVVPVVAAAPAGVVATRGSDDRCSR